MVRTDDNFSTIVKAVALSIVVVSEIRKAVQRAHRAGRQLTR